LLERAEIAETSAILANPGEVEPRFAAAPVPDSMPGGLNRTHSVGRNREAHEPHEKKAFPSVFPLIRRPLFGGLLFGCE
jgi:hypothetical protein